VQFAGNSLQRRAFRKPKFRRTHRFLCCLSGQVDRKKIEEDVEKIEGILTDYGCFKARSAAGLRVERRRKLVTLTYHISLKVRAMVNNVSFTGNKVYARKALGGGRSSIRRLLRSQQDESATSATSRIYMAKERLCVADARAQYLGSSRAWPVDIRLPGERRQAGAWA